MLANNFKELITTLLPPDQQESYFQYCQKPLKKSLTLNTTKISPVMFEQYAHDQGWILKKHPFLLKSSTYYIDRPDTSIALGNHRMHQCGYYYIQEIAASTPAYLLDLPENALVLDIAASPGGKTCQLASKLQTTNGKLQNNICSLKSGVSGLIIANDIDSLRIRTLQQNLRRMGCWNTATSKLDGTKWGERYPETFDAVLVDAPCSGEGTGFKSDDALTHRRIEEIKKIAGLQKQILRSAIQSCKVGGQIIYSTCTLNTLENEGVLAEILREFGDSIQLEKTETIHTEEGYVIDGFDEDQAQKVARFRPHLQKTGGFFVSKMTKISGSTPFSCKRRVGDELKNKSSTFYGTTSSPTLKRIKTLLKEYYGIELNPSSYLLFLQGDTCYFTSPKVLGLPFSDISTGIPLGKLVRDTWIPTHFLGTTLGHLATKNIIEITDEQAQDYVDGKELLMANSGWLIATDHPFFLLQHQGQGIGTVKWVQGIWKSKFTNE